MANVLTAGANRVTSSQKLGRHALDRVHSVWKSGFVLWPVYSLSEQHKMRSQLTAQFMPFFRLIARILTFRDRKYRILTFCDKKFRILTFCDKTELYLTVLQQNNVEACSLWLSLALSGSLLLALALSGSLLLSEFAYNILARLTRPLLSSQRRCCAATLSAALLRTWFHDNLCYLTIKSDTGQHSQFLRCFF